MRGFQSGVGIIDYPNASSGYLRGKKESIQISFFFALNSLSDTKTFWIDDVAAGWHVRIP